MKIIKPALFSVGLLFLFTGQSIAQTAEDALGVWRHPDNGSHIEVSKCDGGLCAEIVKVKDPARKDMNNPDPAKRERPVVGITIMNGAKKSGARTWSGKLYNTQAGETYRGTLTVLGENRLKLQGCVFGGLICQGPTWTRVE